MLKNKPNLKTGLHAIAKSGAMIVGLALASGAYAADSARIKWDTNGHFYQLFEGAPMTWANAKTACEGKSAHLATITSEAENGFILSQLLAGRTYWYSIGGTSSDTYKWTWITGEAWGFQPFAANRGYPQHHAGQNYVAISADKDNYGNRGYGGQWFTAYSSDGFTGYICEWSTQNYIDTTLVPDMNNNGVDEVAALYVDFKTGKHTVQIKDPATDTVLKILVFATSFTPPSGLVVLHDTNDNGAAEIGVLFTQFGFPNVQIIDTKTSTTVRNIAFLTPASKPKTIGVGADTDANGADEIIVLGINKTSGAAKAEIHDSKTGQVTNNTPL
jgi:hypothetical protein